MIEATGPVEPNNPLGEQFRDKWRAGTDSLATAREAQEKLRRIPFVKGFGETIFTAARNGAVAETDIHWMQTLTRLGMTRDQVAEAMTVKDQLGIDHTLQRVEREYQESLPLSEHEIHTASGNISVDDLDTLRIRDRKDRLYSEAFEELRREADTDNS